MFTTEEMHPFMQRTLSDVWLPNYSSGCITCPVPLSALCAGKCTCPGWPLPFIFCAASITCISDQGGRGTVADQNFKWVKSSVQTKKLNSTELCLLWRLTCTFPKDPKVNKVCFYFLFADFVASSFWPGNTWNYTACNSSFICDRFHGLGSRKEEMGTGFS